MSNWGGQPKPDTGDGFERARAGYLIAVTIALLLLGAAFVFTDRYAIGQAGGLPARLDRLTGQVIACAPPRGCVEIIPAGRITLSTVLTAPKPGAPAAPAPPPETK